MVPRKAGITFILSIILLTALGMVSSCTGNNQSVINPLAANQSESNQSMAKKMACSADADCVPASCCHADSCVPKSEQLQCKGIMCTMDCRAGTMDCGQGRCACKQGGCQAITESLS